MHFQRPVICGCEISEPEIKSLYNLYNAMKNSSCKGMYYLHIKILINYPCNSLILAREELFYLPGGGNQLPHNWLRNTRTRKKNMQEMCR